MMATTVTAKRTTKSMFSVEFDWDDVTITVLDDTGEEEDLAVILFDDVVYLRQFLTADTDKASIISITPAMMDELMEAWSKPDGMYKTIKLTR